MSSGGQAKWHWAQGGALRLQGTWAGRGSLGPQGTGPGPLGPHILCLAQGMCQETALWHLAAGRGGRGSEVLVGCGQEETWGPGGELAWIGTPPSLPGARSGGRQRPGDAQGPRPGPQKFLSVDSVSRGEIVTEAVATLAEPTSTAGVCAPGLQTRRLRRTARLAQAAEVERTRQVGGASPRGHLFVHVQGRPPRKRGTLITGSM